DARRCRGVRTAGTPWRLATGSRPKAWSLARALQVTRAHYRGGAMAALGLTTPTLAGYPLKFPSDPIPAWRKRVARLRSEQNAHIALNMYRSFMDETADLIVRAGCSVRNLRRVRHGLRASEVCGLEWHRVELDQGAYQPYGFPSPRGKARQGRKDAICGASAHASARLRLQARQRRARHPLTAALPRAQEHSTHRALYRAKPGPV